MSAKECHQRALLRLKEGKLTLDVESIHITLEEPFFHHICDFFRCSDRHGTETAKPDFLSYETWSPKPVCLRPA